MPTRPGARRALTLAVTCLVTVPAWGSPAHAVSTSATANPFAGRQLQVSTNRPVDGALRQAAARHDTATAAALRRVAAQPSARWYGPWLTGGALTRDVSRHVGDGRRLSVLVAYALPHRDCGGDSAGGLTAAQYSGWIRNLATGFGRARPVVVLEPDAVTLIDCLSASQRAERWRLLSAAVSLLNRAGASVYLDAGHAGWATPDQVAPRLRASGIAYTRGITLNVSSFGRTDTQRDWVRRLNQLLPGVHALVDVSRNGRGPTPDNSWCNPTGRALGANPHLLHDRLLDAVMWIKPPGESDGDCGRHEPAAGTFWTGYAVGLVSRAR